MRISVKTTILIYLLASVGCREPEEVTVVRALSTFEEIRLNGVFDVYLIQGTEHNVRIQADEDIVDHISSEVTNGILTLENKGRLKWTNPSSGKVKVYITFASLKRIEPAETCSIQTVNTLRADDFWIVVTGSPKLMEVDLDLDCNFFNYWSSHQCGGKIVLTGRTDNLWMAVFSLMTVEAKGLQTDNATIETYSKGDCELTVNENFAYSIHGEGDILLHGNPSEILLVEKTSEGELIRMDQ